MRKETKEEKKMEQKMQDYMLLANVSLREYPRVARKYKQRPRSNTEIERTRGRSRPGIYAKSLSEEVQSSYFSSLDE
jgi:hypothetical protein